LVETISSDDARSKIVSDTTDNAETLKSTWPGKAETASLVKQRMHVVMAWGWAHGQTSQKASTSAEAISHGWCLLWNKMKRRV
jgi:hypothetical protein